MIVKKKTKEYIRYLLLTDQALNDYDMKQFEKSRQMQAIA